MPRVTAQDATPVVLVVDDQAIVREVLRAALTSHGFRVQLAGDGREAIETFWRGSEAIEVVLLDVQMPGLDGPLVLAALQTLDPGVRAYFMTGDPGRYGEDELLAAGARRVFAKPLDLADVVAELRRCLAGVGAAAARPSP